MGPELLGDNLFPCNRDGWWWVVQGVPAPAPAPSNGWWMDDRWWWCVLDLERVRRQIT